MRVLADDHADHDVHVQMSAPHERRHADSVAGDGVSTTGQSAVIVQKRFCRPPAQEPHDPHVQSSVEHVGVQVRTVGGDGGAS
ncbi:MAG: hypothetical protein Q7S02_04015, partial [bacterium]|nr:hypothetical protein [bacterium]